MAGRLTVVVVFVKQLPPPQQPPVKKQLQQLEEMQNEEQLDLPDFSLKKRILMLGKKKNPFKHWNKSPTEKKLTSLIYPN